MSVLRKTSNWWAAGRKARGVRSRENPVKNRSKRDQSLNIRCFIEPRRKASRVSIIALRAFLSAPLENAWTAWRSAQRSSRSFRLWSSFVRYSGKRARPSTSDEKVSARPMTLCWKRSLRIPDGVLHPRVDELRVLHQDDVDELELHHLLHFHLDGEDEALEPRADGRLLGEARQEPLADELAEAGRLGPDEAEDEERALDRRGRLDRLPDPLRVAEPLEELDEERREGRLLARVGHGRRGRGRATASTRGRGPAGGSRGRGRRGSGRSSASRRRSARARGTSGAGGRARARSRRGPSRSRRASRRRGPARSRRSPAAASSRSRSRPCETWLSRKRRNDARSSFPSPSRCVVRRARCATPERTTATSSTKFFSEACDLSNDERGRWSRTKNRSTPLSHISISNR